MQDDVQRAAGPEQFPDSPLSQIIRQPLILGLFLPVQSGGWSASLLPRTTDWRFDYNAALTRRAEELGFDLAFGLAQWAGKGGYGGVPQKVGKEFNQADKGTGIRKAKRKGLNQSDGRGGHTRKQAKQKVVKRAQSILARGR